MENVKYRNKYGWPVKPRNGSSYLSYNRADKMREESEWSDGLDDFCAASKKLASAEKDKNRNKGGRPLKLKNGSSYLDYAPADIVEFVAEIQKFPSVWDASRENCHRKEQWREIYDKIEKKCSRFITRGKTHGNVARDLWLQLKEGYTDEVKKIQKAPSGSGVTSKKRFPFFTELSFLDGPL